MVKIKSIKAREILDSRGNPTVETTVTLSDGKSAWAAVPSGASTGDAEALELRDGDKKRYNGKGVLKAVKNVNTVIAKNIIGQSPYAQKKLDQLMIELDGTDNKSHLGANAILSVSLAVARAASKSKDLPLYRYLRQQFFKSQKGWAMPYPTINIVNGGAHAGWAIDFQEHMIVPQQRRIHERIRCGSEIFHALQGILKNKGQSVSVGDEGGFAPTLNRNEEALVLIMLAIGAADYRAGSQVKIAMDPATSEFYEKRKQRYVLKTDGRTMTTDQLIDHWVRMTKKYPIVSLEDGLAQNDWAGWQKLTKALGKKIDLVGDDLFVTNKKILQRGIEMKAGNAILIKPNQIGSLSETVETIDTARKHHYKISVSHRSGETIDDFIADLSVAARAEYIKTGSMSRSERSAKYNRLMQIADELKV
ncbi:MAG: phosphopyruvate hydratase [Candidatus Buchananbacteria bacterium CG10_big_fil_rev_8_21_14_0_10_42_9]|uniref:Enolase n=1 Tax=Candidatus Buchananbacteria bacterium CG10_big_fil_rev_8_21_14_0_10_42_9 TaxID=1974526 RepID=A0A2H0W2D4_9BACT|nr:MAG: phosphopyruvate hydratase [Candidatus Buchananbacteria bacterium CG10_big_fil_rev_8_21_14_0_10_42_9]